MENFEKNSDQEIIELLYRDHKLSDFKFALNFFQNEEMIPSQVSDEKSHAFMNLNFLLNKKSESEKFEIISRVFDLLTTNEPKISSLLDQSFHPDFFSNLQKEIQAEIKKALHQQNQSIQNALYLKKIAEKKPEQIHKLKNDKQKYIAQLFLDLKNLGGDFEITDNE